MGYGRKKLKIKMDGQHSTAYSKHIKDCVVSPVDTNIEMSINRQDRDLAKKNGKLLIDSFSAPRIDSNNTSY